MTTRALVMGGGGVLGFAWLVGAVAAVEAEAGFDARDTDLVVGTSAGAILAAALACGLGMDEIQRIHQGVPAPDDHAVSFEYDLGRPPWPRPGLGSPALAAKLLRRRSGIQLRTRLFGAVPAGRGNLGPVGDLVDGFVDGMVDASAGRFWPQHPRAWICATDYRSGRRTVFGRDVLPAYDDADYSLSDAVVASCSIPGWYPPKVIAGRPYIDGGTVSNASADLLIDTSIEEVYVLAPMASVVADHPRALLTRLERIVRAAVTRTIMRDVARLRAAGKRVVVVTPGPEDLATMGSNLMNPQPRAEVLRTAARTAPVQLRAQFATRPWTHPTSPRPISARPTSGRPVSERLAPDRLMSARPPRDTASSGRVEDRVRPPHPHRASSA
jgi:NTE family protein